jgi:hypothetical protein
MEEPCVFIIEVHAELAGPERLIDSKWSTILCVLRVQQSGV